MKPLNNAALAAAVLGASPGSLVADEVADFYQDRTVTVISPSGVGGSIYQYTLLVANHIGKHIPGNPTTIAEERGGGGGVTAANFVANAAPDNGLVIAQLHPSSLIIPLTRDMTFDFSEVTWLGSVAVRPYVGVVWHEVEANTLEAMRDTPVIFGSSGVGGSSYQYPAFMALVSGAQIELIPGYSSGGAMNLAMERGEIQGRGNYYEGFLATNPDWVENGMIQYVWRMGPDHPDLMDVPRASDYPETDEDRQMLRLLEAPLDIGQAFYIHQNVPEERKEALLQAFSDMLEDEEFLAEADMLGLIIRPLSAEAVTTVVADVYSTPRDLAEALDEIFRQ